MANDVDMSGWSELLHSSSKLLEQAAPSAQFPPIQVLLKKSFFGIEFHIFGNVCWNDIIFGLEILEEFGSIGSINEEIEG